MIDSLGWVLFKKNRLEEAIPHLAKASELLPEDPTIMEHLGEAYLKRGSAQKALEIFNKALHVNPENEKLKEKVQQLKGR
jgi:tetratricopeptide (TPR) repeat protein